MSTAAITFDDAHRPGVGLLDSAEALFADLSQRLYRFFVNLPDRFDDVDMDVFKRVPVPI